MNYFTLKTANLGKFIRIQRTLLRIFRIDKD